MKEYEKPVIGIIDFAAEEIMDDSEVTPGFSKVEEDVEDW